MLSFKEKRVTGLGRLLKDATNHVTFLEMMRKRVAFLIFSGLFLFLIALFRLASLMLFQNTIVSENNFDASENKHIPRADIIDRNGNVIATHIVTASLYANPKILIDPQNTAKQLNKIFPQLSYKSLLQKLSNTSKSFIWIARHIPPKTQHEINLIGQPGLVLQKDHKRMYPYGKLFSHVVGYSGLDNDGLAGVEKKFDKHLKTSATPLKLSLDLRIQASIAELVSQAIAFYQAKAGNAIVMNIKTGEVLGMVSLPVFDPHNINDAKVEELFHINTLGVYEPGSTWKILNTAIALETGLSNPNSHYDARHPIKIGRFTITDFKGKNRFLNLTEAFVYSSNIAAVKVAQQFGSKIQQEYFRKFGVFKPSNIEVPEMAMPLLPKSWKESTLMSASYGYGISLSPLHAATIIGTLINNGEKVQPTLIYNSKQNIGANSEHPVISKKTSATIREMMRATTLYGGSRKANIQGYSVFAKTGTAYTSVGKKYNGKDRFNSCIAGFPFHNPRYLVYVGLHSPKALPETYFYNAAGWNAAPTAGKIIERIAPVLNVQPDDTPTTFKNVSWLDESVDVPQSTVLTNGQ